MTGKSALQIVTDTGKSWARHKAPRLSAALAFFALLSLSPVLLVATSVAGFFYEGQVAQEQLVQQVRDLSGPEGAAVVEKALTNARFSRGKSVWAAAASIVILLFSASAVFVQLQSSLNTIWQVEPGERDRSLLGRLLLVRGLSVAMVLVLGLLFLVSLVISAMLAGLHDYLTSIWEGLGVFVTVVHALVSLGLIGLLFSLIFRVLPDTEVDPGASWIGGFATVLLLSVGKWAIGLYLGNSAVGSAYGAAASVIVFMLWIYYTMLVVFFGAEFTHVLSERFQAKT